MFGKPMPLTYDFAEAHLGSYCEKNDISVTKYYMIGDNPHSDIEGAK
jgi:ribonucleotide monophosphatase NagD (HAD superfamily)